MWGNSIQRGFRDVHHAVERTGDLVSDYKHRYSRTDPRTLLCFVKIDLSLSKRYFEKANGEEISMDETLSENDFRYIIGREIQKLLWSYE